MSETIEVTVPDEQEGTRAVVRSWLVKIGDHVEKDAPLVELETDKVTQEVPAPVSGTLAAIVLDTDREAEPGAVLGRMTIGTGVAAAKDSQDGDVAQDAAAPPPAAHDDMAARLSPAVRRAVKQHGLDPATIEGTGRDGRITRADVDEVVAKGTAAKASPAPSPAPAALGTAATGSKKVTTVSHDRMRLSIAQNMLNSVTVAPHVTAVFECDFSAIIAHRKQHKPAFEKDGAKLTFTAYLVAACAAAMKAAPTVNSRWYDDRLEIFDDINVGVGTALGDKGLVVPVIKRVQDLSLQGIAKQLTDTIARARDNRLTGADVSGGTFTISNHGVSGSLVASPVIINQPQSAILGVGKLEKRVVVREIDGVDTIQIRPMCYVSLTIDHRVLDGHQTNAWLGRFVETIESWPQ